MKDHICREPHDVNLIEIDVVFDILDTKAKELDAMIQGLMTISITKTIHKKLLLRDRIWKRLIKQ